MFDYFEQDNAHTDYRLLYIGYRLALIDYRNLADKAKSE